MDDNINDNKNISQRYKISEKNGKGKEYICQIKKF